jgi:ribosomal-protein-alanine N-acetyltransferase
MIASFLKTLMAWLKVGADANARVMPAGISPLPEVKVPPPNGLFHFRPMQLEDVEQVHAIDVMSFSVPWPASSYRFELQENPASLLWVAEAMVPEGKPDVIGMIVVWLILDEAHIATIAVHPDYRGRGIGGEILTVALRESARKGAKKATLEVRAGNEIARKLYGSFGFQVVGQRSRYYQDNNEDALIMSVSDLDLKKLGVESPSLKNLSRKGDS